MSVVVVTHESCLDHGAGPGHPETADRLRAAWRAVDTLGLDVVEASVAPVAALARVHTASFLSSLADTDLGPRYFDPDTSGGPGSWGATLHAAGAGLDAVALLDRGDATAAWCVVRPPGHHANADEARGFCLVNSVAVVAADLAARGERVAVVDIDAHHGNGTQDLFYDRDDVLYVSLHQWPLYPGTGWFDEVGVGAGAGYTVNVPLPPRCTGDVYCDVLDRVVVPALERFAPTWLLLSVGFDTHWRELRAGMALTTGDHAAAVARLTACVPPGRTIAYLEGGYDLEAVESGSRAVLSALAGDAGADERPSRGGPGADHADAAAQLWARIWSDHGR